MVFVFLNSQHNFMTMKIRHFTENVLFVVPGKCCQFLPLHALLPLSVCICLSCLYDSSLPLILDSNLLAVLIS